MQVTLEQARAATAELSAPVIERVISAAIATAMFRSAINEQREPTTCEILAEIDAIRDLCHVLVHNGAAQPARNSVARECLEPWLRRWKRAFSAQGDERAPPPQA